MAEQVQRPKCEDCGTDLVCESCDDTRPKAEKLDAGWLILSPFNTWETVTKVEQANGYAPVRVWTAERGGEFSWEYPRWRKVDARKPLTKWLHGEPEIRAAVGKDRTRMWVAATTDTTRHGWNYPEYESILAEAGHEGRGKGWWVRVAPGMGVMDAPTFRGLTKDQARSELKRRAKEFGKALKVKVTVDES